LISCAAVEKEPAH